MIEKNIYWNIYEKKDKNKYIASKFTADIVFCLEMFFTDSAPTRLIQSISCDVRLDVVLSNSPMDQNLEVKTTKVMSKSYVQKEPSKVTSIRDIWKWSSKITSIRDIQNMPLKNNVPKWCLKVLSKSDVQKGRDLPSRVFH